MKFSSSYKFKKYEENGQVTEMSAQSFWISNVCVCACVRVCVCVHVYVCVYYIYIYIYI